MRIISGTARGTNLYTLEGNDTRPTLDRVKESLFSIIQLQILDSNVLDLFAGSGALGLESLSRGAKHAVFCDNSYKASEILKKNIEKTHLKDKSTIITKDYLKALEELKNYKFDIIFLDPPYKFNLIGKAVEKILELNILNENGIMIVETDEEKRDLEILNKININIYDFRVYGRAKLIFLNRKG